MTEAELDLGFALLEKADRDLAADLNIYGVIAGAVPAPHAPVPDLTVDLTAPARAYDNLGQRMFFGTGQTVDCAVDPVGIPTDVATVGNERWLGIFLRFKRQLSDPRTDGNSQQVFFRRDESFELVVRQAPEGAIGVAPKPTLQADELLLCDVRRRPGQTQILAADLDTSRRQAFIFAQGSSVSVVTGTWSILQPLAATVQAALDETDAELRDHFTAVARRHAATAIDYAPHGFVGAGNVQAAVDELIDDLATGAAGSSGASRVGEALEARAAQATSTEDVTAEAATPIHDAPDDVVAAAPLADAPTPDVARADDEGEGTEPDGARLQALTVAQLRTRYLAVVGRSTRSHDKRYLIWKIRQAQQGRVPVGPVGRRQPGETAVEHKVLPLRMPAETILALDEVWRRRGLNSRMDLFRHALEHYLTGLGEEGAASRVRSA